MSEKRYVYIRFETIYDLLTHVGILICLGVIIVLVFFQSILPSVTLHQEAVTVPDLVGMPVSEIENFLSRRDLDFMIVDSSFSQKHKPHTVLTQSPEPGELVKRFRKLRLAINPLEPPKVRLPNLIDMPFSEAKRTLRSEDLKLGRIKYKPHAGLNSILEFSFKGQKYDKESLAQLDSGVYIPKGSTIDLLIGDGLGETEFPMPDLVTMQLDEAQLVLKGHNLVLDVINYNFNSRQEIGTVLSQSPKVYIGKLEPGIRPGGPMDNRLRMMVREGEVVALVVAGNPAAEPMDEEEILSEEEQRKKDSLNTNINIRDASDLERIRDKRRNQGKPEKADSTKKNIPEK